MDKFGSKARDKDVSAGTAFSSDHGTFTFSEHIYICIPIYKFFFSLHDKVRVGFSSSNGKNFLFNKEGWIENHKRKIEEGKKKLPEKKVSSYARVENTYICML